MTIFQYYPPPPPTPEIEEANVGLMYDNGESDDNEGVGLPEVYEVVTLTEAKHDELQATTTNFIHQQAEDSNY